MTQWRRNAAIATGAKVPSAATARPGNGVKEPDVARGRSDPMASVPAAIATGRNAATANARGAVPETANKAESEAEIGNHAGRNSVGLEAAQAARVNPAV